jgi:Uma2 family endonuclease
VAGYTASGLDWTPGLPSHTELIDGSLITASPQRRFHSVASSVIEVGLRRCAPPENFRVRRDMSVVIGLRQRPEPDVVVVFADADIDAEGTWYPAGAVALAVEVVSPDSEVRDRRRKPQLYAEAGIRYFWRLERVSRTIALYAYELDTAINEYSLVGIYHEVVKLGLPFDIAIDLTEIDRL